MLLTDANLSQLLYPFFYFHILQRNLKFLQLRGGLFLKLLSSLVLLLVLVNKFNRNNSMSMPTMEWQYFKLLFELWPLTQEQACWRMGDHMKGRPDYLQDQLAHR